MELSRDKVLDFSDRRGVDVCETINLSVHGRVIRVGACCRCLADTEGEGEHELVIVAKFQYECGRA